jgi:hypothetical protein
MEQNRDNKPNPKARPTQERGNTSAAGGGPNQAEADPTGRNAQSGGAFGKEGHSNRRGSVDNTGEQVEHFERTALDDDTPRSAVGDPHLTRVHAKESIKE